MKFEIREAPVWAEINLNAIEHNIKELRRITDPKAALMAVVKANAYGHGDVEVARCALHHSAKVLGVARLNEGIRLREAGIDAPILILGYTSPELGKKLIDFNLTQTIFSYKTAKTLNDIASSAGKKIKVHVKTDTGMGRLGIMLNQGVRNAGVRSQTPDKSQQPRANNTQQPIPSYLSPLTPHPFHEIESIARLSNLKLEGIFTHFATADDADKTFAKKQFEIFMDFLNQLRFRGVEIPIRHAANSAAIIEIPETHLDMVRAGISLYGLYPSEETDKRCIALKPAMALKAKVVQLKKVPANFTISYGCTYKTDRPTTIATVSVGYADGLNRLLSSKGYMLVHGERAPIVGRVCMDLTMLDVGHIPDVDIEDEVVIFGTQGDSEIMVDEIAAMLNTINYEIVSTITDRVPRIFGSGSDLLTNQI